MGYHKDLGRSVVTKVDPVTGFPMNEYGHLLDKSDHNGGINPNWRKKGTELWNLTSPYGFLTYAIGTADDFWCFDFAVIKTRPNGGRYFLVLHAVINSETGGFIEDGGYEVVSFVPRQAYQRIELQMIEQALDWLNPLGDEKPIRHDKRGWKQDPWFFARSVYLATQTGFTGSPKFTDFSERQRRFGGKRINTFCGLTYL